MINKDHRLRRISLYLLLVLIATGYTGFIYISGITHGREMQLYFSSPLQALEKTNFMKMILDDGKKNPDCLFDASLNSDVVTYKGGMDSIPKWRKIFFPDDIKKLIVYNERFLEYLRKYREQYPLSAEYFMPCAEFLDANANIEEAWNFIMNGK